MLTVCMQLPDEGETQRSVAVPPQCLHQVKLPTLLPTFRDGCPLSMEICFAIFTTISILDGENKLSRIALGNVFRASIMIRPRVHVAWFARYVIMFLILFSTYSQHPQNSFPSNYIIRDRYGVYTIVSHRLNNCSRESSPL